MKRPRVEIGRKFNPLTMEDGSGNYLILPCRTADEQCGCISRIEDAAQIPSAKWITIEQLGMNWRLRESEFRPL